MGGGGSSPSHITQSGTSIVKNEPPEWLTPYGKNTLNASWNLAMQPYQAYPGQTVAGLSPEQQAAMYMTAQRALHGSPVGTAAQNMATNTLNGAYFDNPYLSNQIRLAQDEAAPAIGYMGRQGGSYGNTGINQAWTNTMGNIAGTMRYQNYGDERNRQLQAMGYAPELAGLDYQDAQMLMGIGDARRAYESELLADQRAKWDEALQWPYSQIDWFTNVLRGAGYGSGAGTSASNTSGTQPNPYQSNPMANFIGGGLALGGLADVLSKMG